MYSCIWVHRFSKRMRATSKLYVPEVWHSKFHTEDTQILGAMLQNLTTWVICSMHVLTLNASTKGMCLLFFMDSKQPKIILIVEQTESYIPDRKYVNWLLKWRLMNMWEAAVWVCGMTRDERWGILQETSLSQHIRSSCSKNRELCLNFITTYKGESNENLKFVIKNRNFAPLSCKLVSVLQTACRMACRWQHSVDARTPSQCQYKDGCPTWDLHQGRTAFCYSVFA